MPYDPDKLVDLEVLEKTVERLKQEHSESMEQAKKETITSDNIASDSEINALISEVFSGSTTTEESR